MGNIWAIALTNITLSAEKTRASTAYATKTPAGGRIPEATAIPLRIRSRPDSAGKPKRL